jgi:hypothetical protein
MALGLCEMNEFSFSSQWRLVVLPACEGVRKDSKAVSKSARMGAERCFPQVGGPDSWCHGYSFSVSLS